MAYVINGPCIRERAVAVLALVLGVRLLSAAAGRADAGRLDLRGFLLLSPGLAGVVFGLSETETRVRASLLPAATRAPYATGGGLGLLELPAS